MKTPAAYVTQRQLDKAFNLIGEFVAKLKPLEKRIAELEARPELRHRGVWREGKSYRAASICTHAGSLWLANKATKQRPGQSPAWTLVCKGGRND